MYGPRGWKGCGKYDYLIIISLIDNVFFFGKNVKRLILINLIDELILYYWYIICLRFDLHVCTF